MGCVGLGLGWAWGRFRWVRLVSARLGHIQLSRAWLGSLPFSRAGLGSVRSHSAGLGPVGRFTRSKTARPGMPLQRGCPRRPRGRCERASGHAQPQRSAPGGLRDERCPSAAPLPGQLGRDARGPVSRLAAPAGSGSARFHLAGGPSDLA